VGRRSVSLRLAAGGIGLTLVAASQAVAAPSAITAVEVAGTQPAGTFGGVAYIRTWGVVRGRVAPSETIAGLAVLPKDAAGDYAYSAEFEITAPSPLAAANSSIFVEAENRGSPLILDQLNRVIARGAPSTAVYPEGMGNGWLFNHRISYARVQWQTGIAKGVPDQAQGVGEVITRDFGRLLAGPSDDAKSGPYLGAYKTRVLGGVSQSAWFVNSFIAEGFNAEPATGNAVFEGALAIDGAGDWMTINQLAASHSYRQYPYLNEAGAPLLPAQLLTRPKSDPFYVDVANYNDFYRVRASLSAAGVFPARMRRYDWPSPHAPGSKAAFGHCNAGAVIPVDPIGYAPYARAVLLELFKAAGSQAAKDAPALPPNTLFALATPPADPVHFNALPDAAAKIPALDAAGQPVGGVRFADVEAPFGKPLLPLPHVGLDSIDDTCGNTLAWQPFTPAELAGRYGSVDGYLARYGAALDRLIAKGYLLAADKPEMLKTAAAYYASPAN
jgi:hypothetical protein